MDIKKIFMCVATFTTIAFIAIASYSYGVSGKPVYKRVYTSDHRGIEKAMREANINFSQEQLDKMYECVKLDKGE